MAIDRQDAVRTALRLLDEEGLDKLSLRRIAAELKVQAPALYWHFENKRALLDYVTDLIIAPALPDLAAAPDPGRWPQWLDNAALALRRELLAHPDGARVALGADLRRATALGAVFERTIVVLSDAGFDLPSASRATGSFIAFVLGRIVEEQSLPDLDVDVSPDLASNPASDPAPGSPTASRLDVPTGPVPGLPPSFRADLAARMPTFTRAMAERFAAGESPEETFRFSIGILIAGLQALLPVA